MTIDELMAKGWVFGPYWLEQKTRTGTGPSDGFCAFHSWGSAMDARSDALHVGKTRQVVTAKAAATQVALTQLLDSLATRHAGAKVRVVDSGMCIFAVADLGTESVVYHVTGKTPDIAIGTGFAEGIMATAMAAAAGEE